MDTRTAVRPPNRLIHETSPYLLQHAHNPVDWHAWNEEALAKARTENKPILLSIGYSACHWCHVMEHESFEDEGVARVMNELYVCIKVDREERPDLDKIYQTAHQLLAQRPGGWPLNMFLTPDDRTPFFGGTYFPKDAKYNMPAFVDILQRVATFYREHRAEIEQQNESVRAAFARIAPSGAQPGVKIQPSVLAAAQQELAQQFDARYGGFGQAPKFPHPTNLERCLRYWAQTGGARGGDTQALEMAQATLRAMARGGIYDQLGGGFYRYSVDEKWMIPHFEKMLYDNGPLLTLYSDAARATGDALFARVATATAQWLMREMQAPDGGYYSTLDADSEGHEGKFYVWTREEVRAVLNDHEYTAVAARYGFDGPPNFENRWWHLHVYKDAGADAALRAAHDKLLAVRDSRIRPGRDEKILTSWNGLAIKGMARAGRLLQRPEFVASAERAFDFIRAQLWRDGRLLATTKDGKAHLNAYLDDYVFLIDGGLELLQARWRDGDLNFLIELADVLLDRFQDLEHGGFFFTADDHEKLIYRPKPASDEATPAGNGIAAQVLLRLGHVLGNSAYLDAAERCLLALYGDVLRYPSAHCALLHAIEEFLYPPQTVILRGAPGALAAWCAALDTQYAPRRLTLAIPSDAADLPGVLAQRTVRDEVTAYVCSGHQCQAPTGDRQRLLELIGFAPAQS